MEEHRETTSKEPQGRIREKIVDIMNEKKIGIVRVCLK